MPTTSLTMNRQRELLLSDDRRVIVRPFAVGGEHRIRSVIDRVALLKEPEVTRLLSEVLRDFSQRHRDLEGSFEEHFTELAAPLIDDPADLSIERRLLIGSYLTMEYAIEGAALFNPSIVPHPDQSGLSAGTLRFIMSLRATGDGHVSSVAFRTGLVTPEGTIKLHPVSRYVEAARKVRDRTYHKHTFFLKLIEMGAYSDFAQVVLDRLDDEFKYTELTSTIDQAPTDGFDPAAVQYTGEHMRWLARSNYHLTFPDDCDVSEVVIYPVTENESRGIEDARFVRFVDDTGAATYYGTYTAYNGYDILPQLLETTDFHRFRITTLNGCYAQNKGAALFPRKIDDLYMMVSRIDGENLYLMWSSNISFWNEGKLLQVPTFPWEFVQIGNCGSPIETEAGWLLLTHGVGPMRQYCIGAMLLDRDDPGEVIAQTSEPLLIPNKTEREGYVPNVVYTCGALIHADQLILPYAMSDSATTFATIPIDALLNHMLNH